MSRLNATDQPIALNVKRQGMTLIEYLPDLLQGDALVKLFLIIRMKQRMI